jgi:hypothetical protein
VFHLSPNDARFRPANPLIGRAVRGELQSPRAVAAGRERGYLSA